MARNCTSYPDLWFGTNQTASALITSGERSADNELQASSLAAVVQLSLHFIIHNTCAGAKLSFERSTTRQPPRKQTICFLFILYAQCTWMVTWYAFSGMLVWMEIISDTELKRSSGRISFLFSNANLKLKCINVDKTFTSGMEILPTNGFLDRLVLTITVLLLYHPFKRPKYILFKYQWLTHIGKRLKLAAVACCKPKISWKNDQTKKKNSVGEKQGYKLRPN